MFVDGYGTPAGFVSGALTTAPGESRPVSCSVFPLSEEQAARTTRSGTERIRAIFMTEPPREGALAGTRGGAGYRCRGNRQGTTSHDLVTRPVRWGRRRQMQGTCRDRTAALEATDHASRLAG